LVQSFLSFPSKPKKKLVLKCVKKDPEEILFLQKYESEIQALKTMRDLQAKYIIEISSIQFNSPEYHVFVMEYMNQESLIQYLAKVWPLSRDLNRNIIKQFLLAIKEIHDVNIAHFDVKLDNYLAHSEDDGHISVKLADFDTCRILSGTEIEMIPHPENFIGTPEYGAPEMRVTAEVYPMINPKAVDVYSCGISIYLLFTGDKTKNSFMGFEGVFADYGGGNSEMEEEMENFDLQDMVDHMTRLNFQGNDEKRLTIDQVLEMPYAKLCILN